MDTGQHQSDEVLPTSMVVEQAQNGDGMDAASEQAVHPPAALDPSPSSMEPDDVPEGSASLSFDMSLFSSGGFRVVKSIPPAVQTAYVETLKGLFMRIRTHPLDVNSWALLTLFPILCLADPGRGGQSGQRKFVQRFQRFRSGQFNLLQQDALAAKAVIPKKFSPASSSDDQRKAAVIRIAKKGELARAMKKNQSPVSLAIDPSNAPLVKQALEAKHPDRKATIRPQDFSVDGLLGEDMEQSLLDISLASLTSAIKDSPRGSSAGLSGWANDLFLPLLSDPEALESFREIVLLIARGHLPLALRSFFGAALLIPLPKPSVKLDVRPIAIGDGLRRLVARAICIQYKQPWRQFFAPIQFGVAEPAGAEVIVHAIQLLVGGSFSNCVVTLDSSNAFNEVKRAAFVAELQSHFPQLLPFVETCYLEPASLSYFDPTVAGHRSHILSAEGTQQGDPLSPFLFCLALQSVLQETLASFHESFPESLLAPYTFMDDIIIVGRPLEAALFVSLLAPRLNSIGLNLNHKKCHVWSNSPSPQLFESLLPRLASGILAQFTLSHEGIQVLGVPIGSEQYMTTHCRKILEDLDSKFTSIDNLGNVQIQHLLCRLCCIPTLTYLMRTVPPTTILPYAKLCDSFIKRFLEKVLSWPSLDDRSWAQAVLPVRYGGLGLQLPSRSVLPAWVGSWSTVWKRLIADPAVYRHMHSFPEGGLRTPVIASIYAAFNQLSSIPVPDDLRPEDKLPQNFQTLLESGVHVQKSFSHIVQQQAYRDHLNSLDEPGRARLMSCAGSGASGWLTAIPYRASLSLPNDEFRTAVFLRLGLPIPACRAAGQCECGKPMDALGHHALSCSADGWLFIRHNHLRDTWSDIFKQAGLTTRREVAGLFDDSLKRADILAHNFSDGKTALFDVTVTAQHLRTVGAVSKSPMVQGRSACSREQDKIRTYVGANANNDQSDGMDVVEHMVNGYLFYPLAFEVFGLIGNSALSVLRKTASLVAAASCSQFSSSFQNLAQSFEHTAIQKLSVCLQKFNSQMIIRKASSPAMSSLSGRSPSPLRGSVFNPHAIRITGAASGRHLGD